MKFIRDIIGEKREMDGAVNGTAVDAATVSAVLSSDEATVPPASAEPAPEQTPEPAAEPVLVASEPTYMPEARDVPEAKNVTDEIAAFFANEAADQAAVETVAEPTPAPTPDPAPEPVQQAAPAVERQPTKLILTKPLAPKTDEAPTEAPAEAAKPDAMAESIDKVLVSDHTPDPVLEAVLQDAPAQPTPPAPTPEPVAAEPAAPADAAPTPSVEVPLPAVGRGISSHGRVKTRLLGFNTSMDDDEVDPMTASDQAKAAPYTSFPVGWLMVVEGEGRGSAFSLFHGVSTIGRGEDQTIRLDFGDNSISRENHASIAYDPRQKSFFIGHGGKANIVRRNDRPVLSTEELGAGDQITIGETTLRFVPLCGPEFSWDNGQ